MAEVEDKQRMTIVKIREDLDLKIGILIGVDSDGCLFMSAASKSEEEEGQASVLLSRIADVLFCRDSLIRSQTANKVPI
jgi:hypothetical protein